MNNIFFWIFRFLLTVLDHTWHVECVRCIIFGFIFLSTFLVLSGAIIVRKHLTVNVSSATTTFSAEMTSTGPFWKKTFILILLSRQNCSQWKSILFYVPHLHFTFSADLTRKLMFCTKVARKDFTKTKLPSRALSVHMYSYLYFQPIEDSIWLLLSAHPVLAMFVPSPVTRDWDYPLTLPDIPSMMCQCEACDAPHPSYTCSCQLTRSH